MQTATNPQTGEKVQWNGSAWVPMGGAGAPTPMPVSQPQGVVTVGTPKPKAPAIPSGYEADPANPGALRPIPGGPADKMTVETPGDLTKTGDDYLATLPPGLAGQVKAMSEGRRAYPTGTALKDPKIQELIAAATQYDPTLDAANAATRVATRKDFTSGVTSRNITSLNTALGHLGQLKQAADALENRSFPLWNTIANTAETAVGDPRVKNFGIARDAVANELMRVFRGAGSGSMQEIEEWKRTIDSADSPEQLNAEITKAVELLDSRLQALGDQYQRGLGQSKDPITLLSPHAQAVYNALGPGGSGNLPPPDGASPQGVTGSTNGFNETPANEAGAFLDNLVRQRVPYGDARKQFLAAFPGFKGPNGEPGFSPGQYKAAVDFARNNPDTQYRPTQAIERTPLTPSEQTTSNAAMSPLGAFAGNFANGATAGLPVAAAGDQGQFFQQVSREQQPGASFAGDLLGSTAGMLGGEAALGRAGVKAGLGRELVANTGYGAVRGGAENGPSGIIPGGLAGAGGTLAGNALLRAPGALIAPSGGRLNSLFEAGVRPTPGQRFVNSGLPGQALNAAEEHIGSVPLVGAAIRGARQEARDQFQVGAFNQALGELRGIKGLPAQLPKGVGPGTQAHSFTQRVFDKAYDDVRSKLRVVGDDQLAQDLSGLTQDVSGLAQPSIDRFNTILRDTVVRRIENGGGAEITGDAYKQIQSELGKRIRSIRKSQSGDGELADSLEELQHILDGAARRHSDPAAVDALDKIDRGYAKFVLIENASKRGGNAKDAGTFSPTDFSGAVKQGDTRVRSKAYLQGQGLMQDYAEQGKNLADRVPNSGTPERQLAALALAGGVQHFVAPEAAPLLAIIGGAYAPGGRKILKATMTPRGPKAQAARKALQKAAPYLGAGSAAITGSTLDQ